MVCIGTALNGCSAALPPGTKYCSHTLLATFWNGKWLIARWMWPPGSPFCRRRVNTMAMPVPETTPSCPRLDTARARFQFDTATPMPP